ncbi:MAG: NADH-quinone oxidoreductase subunit NuoE [Pseudomonadota bacterium]
MAVRRLHHEQPNSFEFTPENLAFAKETIAKFPDDKQASAVIPLLWRAQEQHDGWLPEPALRYVADMLDMPYIRAYEIATFYTMYQLAPVGTVAHVQVCGTTPCMLRGSEDIKAVCQKRIAQNPHELSADGRFSWEEVECLGSCANAPMVQVWKDTYEDLTPDLFERVLDGFDSGTPPKPGSQIGRQASEPEGGATTLTDASIFDRVVADGGDNDNQVSARGGADAAAGKTTSAASDAGASGKSGAAAGTAPAAVGTASTATAIGAAANKGVLPGLGGAPLASGMTQAATGSSDGSDAAAVQPETPPLLDKPRDGEGDELELIWGVAEILRKRLNDAGIWHFDQIAAWTPANIAWFETTFEGMKGRIARDKWLEQCAKLKDGWRPESNIGERPKS